MDLELRLSKNGNFLAKLNGKTLKDLTRNPNQGSVKVTKELLAGNPLNSIVTGIGRVIIGWNLNLDQMTLKV